MGIADMGFNLPVLPFILVASSVIAVSARYYGLQNLMVKRMANPSENYLRLIPVYDNQLHRRKFTKQMWGKGSGSKSKRKFTSQNWNKKTVFNSGSSAGLEYENHLVPKTYTDFVF